MTDTDIGNAPTVDPSDRGTLEIKHKAVERLAVLAARGTDSVTGRHRGLRVLGGGDLPKADVTINGDRVRAAVAVAVTWPTPVAGVAAEVRDAVTRDLTGLGKYTVDRVDVSVECVPARDDTEHRPSNGGRVQ